MFVVDVHAMTDLFLHQVGSQNEATVIDDGMKGGLEVRRS